MKMKLQLLVLVAITLIALTGCSLAQEFAQVPSEPPQPTDTPYSQALHCLGRQYQAYYKKRREPLVVIVDEIGDDTGNHGPANVGRGGPEFPERLTRPVKLAVEKIHPDIRVAGNSRQAGHIRIEGRFSSFDRADNLIKKGAKWFFYKLAEPFEAALNADIIRARNRLVLDLQAIDLPSELSAPGAYSSVLITMWRGERSVSGSVAAYSMGFSGAVSETVIQPGQELSRAAAELSVLILIGRRLLLPWYRCLDNAPVDELLKERILAVFTAPTVTEETRVRLLQQVLAEHGAAVEVTGRLDSATEHAVQRVMAQYNLLVGDSLPQRYFVLYSRIPFDDRSGVRRGVTRRTEVAVPRLVLEYDRSSAAGAAPSPVASAGAEYQRARPERAAEDSSRNGETIAPRSPATPSRELPVTATAPERARGTDVAVPRLVQATSNKVDAVPARASSKPVSVPPRSVIPAVMVTTDSQATAQAHHGRRLQKESGVTRKPMLKSAKKPRPCGQMARAEGREGTKPKSCARRGGAPTPVRGRIPVVLASR